MEIKWLRVLAIEIFKTVNDLNSNYIKGIFTPKLHPKVRPNQTPTIILLHTAPKA